MRNARQLLGETAVAVARASRRLVAGYSEPDLQRQVDRRGFCIVERYWDAERCRRAVTAMDRLLAVPELLRPDRSGPGDERLFGVDRLDPDLDFFGDRRLARIVSELLQVDARNLVGATMGNRISAVPGSLGSGAGWHRDAADRDQYKTFVYLCDVGEDNGPLQYIESSAWQRRALRGYMEGAFDVGQSRFPGDSPPQLDESAHGALRTITAPAGTLIVANTRGIHRGSPLRAGVRYALTNYYFVDEVPSHLRRLFNDAPQEPPCST